MRSPRFLVATALSLAVVLAPSVTFAGGGYFILGYGPMAHQSAGTAAAVGFDGFAGASNPGKMSFTDDRLDLDALVFMPYRKIERKDSGTIYDFGTKSRNSRFLLPEAGYVHRVDDAWSVGFTLYGNGGLNTEYHGDTGVPGTNANPAKCGDRPGNFFLGCGKMGFDLSQVILATTVSWKFRPGQSFGFSPLIGFQHFKAYGLQAFEGFSAHPEAVSNRGYDSAFGFGARVGWFGRMTPWLDLGAAYSTRIYMQDLDRYRGLIVGGGSFDVPSNFSVGFALKPSSDWTIGADVQRIFFGDIGALRNGTLNSIEDPVNKPFGSKQGSGFHWRNNTVYRGALAYAATTRLTLRSGFAYSERPAADHSANSTSLNLFAPNPLWQVTGGFSFALTDKSDVNFAYGNYIDGTFKGTSATGGLGVGGEESIRAHVNTVLLGWTRRF